MVSITRLVVGSRIAQIAFNCIFSIGIIVGNIVLIGCILSRKQLRQNPKYILILLLALVDLYTGVFVIPIWTHTLFTGTIDFSCALSNTLSGNAYMHPAISCLAIVSLSLDYIFKASVRFYQGTVRKLITFVLALFFLGGPFIVIVPILVNGVAPAFAPSCILALELGYARAALVLSYWAPVACIIFTIIVVIVLHLRSRRQFIYHQYPGAPPQQQPPSTNNTLQLSNPADLILAACLTVALNLPSEIMSVTGISCGLNNCDWYFMLLLVFGYFAEAKALLLPFVWCVNKDFRNIVTGRSTTSSTESQRLQSQPPMYYNQSQILGPVLQGNRYQNNGFEGENEKL